MKKLLIVLLSVFMLAACSESEPKTAEEVVKNVVTDEFVIEENEGNSVTITIDATKAHEGSRQSFTKDSAEIFAGLDKIGVEAGTINWNAPLTDQYGNEKMETVLSIMLDADTFAKVDWSNYERLDLEAIAYGYKKHDALK